MIIVGSIPQYNDEFIIYGYIKDFLLFSKKSQEYRAFLKINNINEKLSCKFISDNYFICAYIIEKEDFNLIVNIK